MKKIRYILALDMATMTGWAVKIDNYKESGTQWFGLKRGESSGMRFLRFRAWLQDMKNIDVPDLIIYEQAHHRGGAATQVGVGMVALLLEFAAENDVTTMPVHSATLKKWATGNGRASKGDMKKESERRGWKPADDNEADATLLLEYGLDELNLKEK